MDDENSDVIDSSTPLLETLGITQEDFEIVPPTTSSLYTAMEDDNYSSPLTTRLPEEQKLAPEETLFQNNETTSELKRACEPTDCQCPNTITENFDSEDRPQETTMLTTTKPKSFAEVGDLPRVENLTPCVSGELRTSEKETEVEDSTQISTEDNDDIPPPYPPPPPPTTSSPDDTKSADTKPVDITISDDLTKSADDPKSADLTKSADDTKSADSKTVNDSKSVDVKSASDNKSEDRIRHEKDHIDAHYDKLPWVFGAISRLLGLEFAPINIPLSRRMQTFAVLFWMSCFLFMGFGAFFILLYMFFFTEYWWISLAYFTWFLGDKSISSRGGRRWRWVRGWDLWRHYCDFFPIEVVKTADLDLSKNYIMGYHPHGILCAGAFSLFATEGSGFSKLFPGFMPYLLTLGGHFLLPIYREFFMATGAVSATRESMDFLLGREGSGRALCLVVGGAKEALDSHPGVVTLHLSKRKGFCKMAIRHGASLVPMFSFGENEIYDQIPNPPGSKIRWVQDTMQKVLGVAPCLFMGRGIFQYSFGIVPFRKPIKIVIGKPIDVPQVRKPTRKQIEDLHAEYVAALKKLYEDHKEKYSMFPDRKIVIV